VDSIGCVEAGQARTPPKRGCDLLSQPFGNLFCAARFQNRRAVRGGIRGARNQKRWLRGMIPKYNLGLRQN
jgi:hypothetical protein